MKLIKIDLEKDYDHICGIWNDRKFEVIPKVALSQSGYAIADENESIAFCWLYPTLRSKTCWFSFPTTNPEYDKQLRKNALDILMKTDMDKFHRTANMRINMNRGEFLKLQGFFDGQIIPQDGMFFPAWVNDKGIKIIERANVKFIKLDTLGDSTLIRFNLAQNNKITRDAIKAIKTSDRIKK